jgi:hypothetical protein
MTKLRELPTVRSENAGPFLLCFDILFSDQEVYRSVTGSKLLAASAIAHVLNIDEAECQFSTFDAALAIKCTVFRRTPSGAVGDWDIYGSAQEFPIAEMEVGPVDLPGL